MHFVNVIDITFTKKRHDVFTVNIKINCLSAIHTVFTFGVVRCQRKEYKEEEEEKNFKFGILFAFYCEIVGEMKISLNKQAYLK